MNANVVILKIKLHIQAELQQQLNMQNVKYVTLLMGNYTLTHMN